ncbi:hypothetical protein VTN77DRAFT_6338 [Rasamsonia byssochlamydoides]|uniref:uncharacterized protein n=1 Tax=Rasamsonia byssochlamydoides TaxID=89139 RepID=UPI0037420E73
MTSLLLGKRKTPEPERDSHNEDPSATPTGSPARKKLKITQSQKQALIDNLQLEITERARKLRAQYALQAQDLRARIERRVNRIPVALRKVTMGELLEKYNAAARPEEAVQTFKKPALPSKIAKPVPTTTISRDVEGQSASSAAPTSVKTQSRRLKRASDDGLFSDKENAPVPTDVHIPLDNPKKRGNPNVAAGQSRAVSQVLRDAEAKILSPKSSNSRTYHQSPLITSPSKPQQQTSYLSRPASPLKPSSPLKAMIENARRTETKTVSPATTTSKTKAASQTKKTTAKAATKPTAASVRSPARPATRQERTVSTGTTSSNLSSGTTIVKSTRSGAAAKRTGTATPSSTTAAKRTTVARSQGPTAAATAKKTAAASKKAVTVVDPPASGRVLRKRV